MWKHRLRSRRAFVKACTDLTRNWQGGHKIPIDVQSEILEGFRKFYDKRHWKYALIRRAVGVAYVNTIADSKSFALINRDGTRTTISKKCKRVNMRRDVVEACRGSVHCEQILAVKFHEGSEVDHCNPGGFSGIFEAWVKDKDIKYLFSQVVHNDPSSKCIKGVKTFKEPTLTQWTTFHKAHASLRELTREEHLHVTKERLNDVI